MKIQIASDLHLELRRNYEPEIHAEDRDVLVLAGDNVHERLGLFEEELRRTPVIYVPGNHTTVGRPESMSITWCHKAWRTPIALPSPKCRSAAFVPAGTRILFGRRDRSHARR